MLLRTRRLVLRPVTLDDVERLVALDSDPEVMRFVSGGSATSATTVADWVIPRMQAQQNEHGTGMWLIHDRDAEFHGWVQLRTPRHSRPGELELSYRLRRESWGCGFAVEASSTLITMMFAETEATRIFASTHSDNLASQRVMQRLGMRLAADTDAEELTDAEAADDAETMVEYELLRDTWYANRGRAVHWAASQRASSTGTRAG
ncbi:MAG: GNAT family N-acetyltransferase [Gordonia sp. (in: high G+C Gram-positive bacteria)]|uniref:GNAT family N-acetyltransferase n=1 Tax=Gordonia sp. (in: high G+C Gram-positive bacteria) TaxID=84139 RepID=UPI0039E48BCD